MSPELLLSYLVYHKFWQRITMRFILGASPLAELAEADSLAPKPGGGPVETPRCPEAETRLFSFLRQEYLMQLHEISDHQIGGRAALCTAEQAGLQPGSFSGQDIDLAIPDG